LLGLAIHRRIPGYQAYPCMYRCLLSLGDWVRICSSMCHSIYTYVNIWGLLLVWRRAIAIITILFKNRDGKAIKLEFKWAPIIRKNSIIM
jgi:hypothetical protein